jgi:toxin ParE1/3/4
MTDLQKTRQAEQDLIEVWQYTADKWGETQADKYLHKIETCLGRIARGSALLKTLSADVRFIRCEHHYIFLLAGKKPIVIAVLHEQMDLLTRIKKRLGT